MAYDGGLATRVREVLGDQPGLVEKQMAASVSWCRATWPAVCGART